MAEHAGYSGTPLWKKLGIKAGMDVHLVNVPVHYFDQLAESPPLGTSTSVAWDMVHIFTKQAQELKDMIPQLKQGIKPNGMIWVSWPKKTSKVPTDITEDTIREVAFANELVDVKVCAVDNVWSALKLVIPLKNR